MAERPRHANAVRGGALLALVLALGGCAAPGPSPMPEPRAPAPQDAPAPERAPEPMPEPEPEPEPDPEPAPVPVPEPDPKPAPVPEPDPAPVPDPAPDPAPAQEPTPAPTSIDVTGRVVLSGRDADVAETVLYFQPDDPTASPEAGRFEIATRDKTFQPGVLAVPRGSTVSFPNEDPILHNVFSVSAGNAFDLGVYGPDAAPEATLTAPGPVNVYCNVHHDMHAHVLVLDTPWFVRANGSGAFTLADLPPGPGTLHAWHRQADPWSIRLERGVSDPVEVRLDIVRPQLPAHTDKTGQSYFRRDRDPYR